ncbi:MAG: DMT family transporter [Tissierellia bacterium]|nr:DMT family transporter [Tissierellia bacterium]
MNNQKNHKIGYFYVITSALIFGAMALLTKLLYLIGFTPLSATFARVFYSIFPSIVVTLRYEKEGLYINIKEIGKIFILSIFFIFTPILLYSSYEYMNSGAAASIHFAYPILIVLFSSFIYRDPPTKIEGICVILAMIGIILLIDFQQIESIKGALLAFGSGVAFALYSVYLEKSGLQQLPPFKLMMYLCIFSSFFAFLFMNYLNAYTKPFTLASIGFGFGYSLIIQFIATLFFQIGVRHIGSKKTGILSTVEPITSLFLGVLVLDEIFMYSDLFAAIIILSAGILLILKGKIQ